MSGERAEQAHDPGRAAVSVGRGRTDHPRMPSAVTVRIANHDLKQAVETALASVRGREMVGRLAGRELLVSTTRDLPPEDCTAHIEAGVFVLVLAAIPRPAEEAAYEAAGARYLPMDFVGGFLDGGLGDAAIGADGVVSGGGGTR